MYFILNSKKKNQICVFLVDFRGVSSILTNIDNKHDVAKRLKAKENFGTPVQISQCYLFIFKDLKSATLNQTE